MRLLLECKADEAVARHLGRTRRELWHFAGKDRVCHALRKHRSLLGMIDEDPQAVQPPYLGGLSLDAMRHDVRLLRDAERDHRVVILCPRLEEWLVRTAAESGVSMTAFGLSDRGNDLHREITSKPERLRDLLDRLLALGSPRLLHLQSLLLAR